MSGLRSAVAGLAPRITQVDLEAFHRQHFSRSTLDHFSSHFMPPCQNHTQDEMEDDGLGYYADGVKRTLTDEQIEIFRHSELEALHRTKIHHHYPGRRENHQRAPNHHSGEAVDTGDLDGDTDPAAEPRKKKKKRGKGRNRKAEVKVDLRKRTWDVVDAGLHSLDYGDDGRLPITESTTSTKRRQISYDDG